MKKEISLFIKKLKEMPDFNRVKFVFLFGSYSQRKQNKLSDIDFAVYYNGNDKDAFKFRIKLMAKLPDKFDVRIFQHLPLYVQKEVITGKVVYSKDEELLYDIAYKIIKEFEEFKRAYYDYIGYKKIEV